MESTRDIDDVCPCHKTIAFFKGKKKKKKDERESDTLRDYLNL